MCSPRGAIFHKGENDGNGVRGPRSAVTLRDVFGWAGCLILATSIGTLERRLRARCRRDDDVDDDGDDSVAAVVYSVERDVDGGGVGYRMRSSMFASRL